MRVLSLRTIVIVAALSVIALVLALGAWVWIGVTNDQYSQLDRRLDSVTSLGDINSLLNTADFANADRPMPDGNLVRTARIGDVAVSVPRNIVLPKLPNGYANTTIDGVQYRVRTFTAGPASIALAAPLAEAQHRINELHLRVLLICASVIGGTVVVGWVISLIMVNPFLLLAQQARAINAQSSPDEVQVRGVREAVEIAEAVEGMLARIGNEQQRTRAALESARDFAAVASHELRTPLTAMRTNLEVLTTLELGPEQRHEVIGDVIRTQSRIEATLTALERLAQGELTTVDDFVPFDITELLDRAAHDALRVYPDVRVSLVPSPTVLMVGLPTGLRLVIDNAIANAVKHGSATEIQLSCGQFRRGRRDRDRRQRHRCPGIRTRGGFRPLLPWVDGVALGFRVGAGAGGPAGRIAWRHSFFAYQPAGRDAAAVEVGRRRPRSGVMTRRRRGGGGRRKIWILYAPRPSG